MKTSLFTLAIVGWLYQTNAHPTQLPVRQVQNQSLSWSSCGEEWPEKLECAQLQVPLDWNNPTAKQTSLNITRVRATSNSSRIGSLIINPGGPGGSAIRLCASQAEGQPLFGKNITDHFDIICPDPRGVGYSNPIRCDANLWNTRQTLFPADNTSYQQMVDKYKAFGESCLNLSGDLVRYMDTVSVAKDFEAVRAALNDGKLNYLGISYGTQIGTTYAELFPQNIRAMALDGMLDHSASETYFVTAESQTYENVLSRFFDWCNHTSTCALSGQNVSQIFDNIISQATQTPIPAPGCLPSSNSTLAGTCFANVTAEEIRFNAQGFLLVQNATGFLGQGWRGLGQALSDASNGNATLLSSPLATGDDSTIWQGLAVGCLDWRRNSNFADNKYKQLLTASLSPRTRGASQSYTYEAQCAGWPIPIANPQRTLNQSAMALTPPLLLVNSYYDPSTSYVWANSVKEQVPNGVLLSRDGVGHTSYLLGGEVNAIVNEYLIDSVLPAADTVVQS